MGSLDLCKMTILCVENNQAISKDLHEILYYKYFQHNVLMSDDYSSALNHIKINSPDIFLISLDLPIEDRLIILSVICNMKLSNRCIATSNCLGDNIMDNYVESGIKHFVTKPIEPENLFIKIDNLMQSRFFCKLNTIKIANMASYH